MQPINHAVSLEFKDSVAILRLDAPPVNALGLELRQGIQEGVSAALAEQASAILIICEGRTFCAGADITEFGKPLLPPLLIDNQAAIEASPVPVVAAIHGTALGGGLELALACHYRVAVPSAQVGLPEVRLGLLPGAGGTQRLPRIVGIATALDMIIGGQPVSARRAHQLGIIDHLAAEDDLLGDALVFIRSLLASQGALPRIRDMSVADTSENAADAVARVMERQPRLFKGFKAPANIAKAVVASVGRSFDEGMKAEQELFTELLESDESAAQIHAFFAEKAVAKVPGLDKDTNPRPVLATAVIGSGTMGTGITLALLGAGFPVRLVDRDAGALNQASSRIAATLYEQAAKGRISRDDADAQIALLTTNTTIDSLGHEDLVIEAVFERMELKQRVFRQLDVIMKPGAILATNTSFLDVNAIASAISRPGDVIGLHFFAPANIMRLLEVVRTDVVLADVLATAMWLGRKLDKVAVISGVCDGFIANRLMAQRGEAADALLLQGPSPADIDRSMVEFGFPMGPYRMLDLVGLDVVGWDRENSAGRTVQELLCEAGNWGQKTGSGYYDYASGKPAPSRVALGFIASIRARKGTAARACSDHDILYELLDIVVNEGAKLIEEGIVYRASDIDMALIAGYGWPIYRGGPMFWGDTVGLGGVVARLKARITNGADIVLSPLLERYADEGRRFVRN